MNAQTLPATSGVLDHPDEASTPVARVAAAFSGRKTDRVPIYHGSFSGRSAELILGRETPAGGGNLWFREACALWEGPDEHAAFLDKLFRDLMELAEITGMDLVRPAYWRAVTERPTKRIDERTFFYGDSAGEYRVMRYDPPTELYQTVEQTRRKEPTLEDLHREVEAAERAHPVYRANPTQFSEALRARDYFRGLRAMRCPGTSLHIPYDPCIWLEACVEEPDLVGRLLDVQAERACRHAELAGRLGLPYLFGGGDCATGQGPMYSPRVFRELMLPRLQKISSACHAHGCKHLFGSDGNLWPVAEDLFGAAGVGGFYEVDRLAGMDLRKMRERYPRVALLGGVASATLHLGSKDVVIAETRDALAAAKECGGILVGCSNQVVAETPPENLFAMLDVLRDER